MSIELLDLAFRSNVRPSSTKFVLVALADYANDWHEAYPSITTLCNRTSQDRKTVMTNLQRLQQAGLIVDTGVRRGKTQQVRVYKILLADVEAKNSPKKGTVPKTGQSHFSPETVPKTGHRTVSEPIFLYLWNLWPMKKNRVGAERVWEGMLDVERQAALDVAKRFLTALPDWQTVPHLSSYLSQRRWEDDLTPIEVKQPKQKKPCLAISKGMPYQDEQLPVWAAKNGYPEPKVGESYAGYRRRLSSLIQQQQR